MEELDKLVKSGMLKSYIHDPLSEKEKDSYQNEELILEFPNGQTLVIAAYPYGYGDSGAELGFEVK